LHPFLHYSCRKLGAVCVTPKFCSSSTVWETLTDQGLSVYRALSVRWHQSAVKRLQELSVCQRMKARALHCHSKVCTSLRGLSAGCKTSWVCLQHHATVVTSNGVTICGSKFPPTVSKHCEHQHSAIHKTILQYEPTIPAVVISKLLPFQSNIMAAFVHSNSRHSFFCLFRSANIQA